MAKVKHPLLSGDVSGAFGKQMIFRKGGIVTRMFKPRNPNSAAQQAQRDYFKENFVMGLIQLGWIECSETWSRIGDHVFTCEGNLIVKYRKGAKVRYKDGGEFEFGYVIGSVFADGVTTVSLAVNSDYGMAETTISDRAISYIEVPEGFPDWLNWSVVYTGLTAQPAVAIARFKIVNKMCFIEMATNQGKTSNATSFAANLPVAAAEINLAVWFGYGRGQNNTVILTVPMLARILAGSSIVNFYTNAAMAGWTASGNKQMMALEMFYEI